MVEDVYLFQSEKVNDVIDKVEVKFLELCKKYIGGFDLYNEIEIEGLLENGYAKKNGSEIIVYWPDTEIEVSQKKGMQT